MRCSVVTVNDLTAIANVDHVELMSINGRTRYAEIYLDQEFYSSDEMLENFKRYLLCKVISFSVDDDRMYVEIVPDVRCGELK